MRSWRSNRAVFLLVCLGICLVLIAGSQLGLFGPLPGIIATPLNAVAGVFSRITQGVFGGSTEFADLETLRQRNADLETALSRFQKELLELREIANDYQRLSQLLNYTSSRTDQEFVAADVISLADANAPLRTIAINKGTRDGIAVGMPVVTDQGLVGRVLNVAASASRVLLVTDPSSAVSGRLLTSRAEGSVIGQPGGDLQMSLIPLNAVVQEGDLVITSGLGGSFPPDIVIGQVTSTQQLQFELFQDAVVRSLVSFDNLEIVLVITSFQPVDLSVFEQRTGS